MENNFDSTRVQVSVQAIQDALAVILAEIVDREGDHVSISHDYFWSLPPASSQVTDEMPPTDLTVGRLSESVQYIEEISSRSKPPVDYALVWVADILRAIAVEPPNWDSEPEA